MSFVIVIKRSSVLLCICTNLDITNEIYWLYEGAIPKMKLSSGGLTPCTTGFPFKVTVLGTHLYQCTSWCCCERLHLASVNFFEDSFNVFAHFVMGDL